MKPPAPGPVSVLSVTQETNAAAMQASTALAALREHLRARLGGEPVARCDCATHPFKATGGGPVSSTGCRDENLRPARGDSRRRRRGVARCGARLARAARLRPGRARLPAHALPERRLRPLEQLLVRGALQLRHLQHALLPARGAVRDPAAGGGDRLDRRARVRGDRLAAMGPDRALVEPDVRGRLGRDRVLGRVPVRARRGARAARDLGAPGPALVALRRARGADARRRARSPSCC